MADFNGEEMIDLDDAYKVRNHICKLFYVVDLSERHHTYLTRSLRNIDCFIALLEGKIDKMDSLAEDHYRAAEAAERGKFEHPT